MNAPPEIASTSPRKVFLVGLARQAQPLYLVEEHLDELEQLAATAGAESVGRVVQRRNAPDSALFIGKGKAEEVGRTAGELGADLVVFDDDLSPSQVKNLEKAFDLAVMDRSGLILEIFRQHARTREARTQVELAQINYLLPRLTRRWRHLGRQAGGIGMRGGEGEKQIEADRRMLRRRIKSLEKDLEKIVRTRETQRRGRQGVPVVSLAGYTNAGKSTLFNRLTAIGGAHTEDRLFATLDARLRRGEIPGVGGVIFTDTVGFIRKLPHHLVSSFKSTLEGIAEADLVLHVIDRSHNGWHEQMEVAEEVLDSLGVERARILRVFNKSDRLAGEIQPGPVGGAGAEAGAVAADATNGAPGGADGDGASSEEAGAPKKASAPSTDLVPVDDDAIGALDQNGHPPTIAVSALTGAGIDVLEAEIAARLGASPGPPALNGARASRPARPWETTDQAT